MGGGTSGQICSPIIPDSSDTLGFVRQSERGVVEAIRSANLTSFAAALAAPALKDVHTSRARLAPLEPGNHTRTRPPPAASVLLESVCDEAVVVLC